MPVVTTVANWLSPFVTSGDVDMANIGMDTPTDSLRTELHDPLLTERQVCAYLNVSKRNLFCWRMAGLIPYFKIGRAVRFRKADVDTALERMRMG